MHDPTGMLPVAGNTQTQEDAELYSEASSGSSSWGSAVADPDPVLPPVPNDYDPSEFDTWFEDHWAMILEAANAYDVPPSVIASMLSVEHSLDARDDWEARGEFAASVACRAPLVNRVTAGGRSCETTSFGISQIQLRRARAVSGTVKDALAEIRCGTEPGAFCSFMAEVAWRSYGYGNGGIIGRLLDDQLNIHHSTAYLAALRDVAPPGTDWVTIYHREFTDLGSYNPDLEYASAFNAGLSYYAGFGV
jgi:hypothetical protein